MTIHEQLMALFLLEKQVRGLESRMDQASRRHQAVTQRLNDFNNQKDALIRQQKETRAQAAQLEGEAQDVQAREQVLRDRMNSVQTNKEYSALLVEFSTLKNERGKIEERALELMTKADEFTGSIEALDGKIVDQQTLVDAAARDVEACQAEVGQKLDSLRQERAEACKPLPPDLLKTFNRLSDAYEGEAMASVEEVNRKRREYSCNGCFMQIPLERVSVLLSGSQQVVTCPSCGRLLYADNSLTGGEARAGKA